MGAAPGPKTLQDIVEYCDGWIPLATRHDIAGQVDRVRQAIADAGRDPMAFEITAYSAKLENIDALADAGVDRAVFNLPPLAADVIVPKLDEWADAIR
jgi:alkanesulfonate monooxygenase SsuD/methylene tetrahydromethanopterin reductase-like flavin-dependent oxidoreductase (luciferase family)